MSCRAAREEPIMEEIYRCGAGLDVHKESVEACVRRIDENGRWQQPTRPWGTMTRDLWARADGRAAPGVTPVALESSGVYGKPISNIRESLQGVAGECAPPEASARAEE
jgi:hypothetical protein